MAGFTTVGQCELADYPYRVLCKHWPDVPKWRDIRDVTAESIKKVGPIKLISAGYPCQPFSLAGKRQGEGDDRHLWPEVYRLLKEVNPDWFIGENVAGHITMGLDQVLSDLESIGYSCQPFVIPACAINADNRRYRLFIIANASGEGLEGFKVQVGQKSGWAISQTELPKFNFDIYSQDRENAYARDLRDSNGLPDWLDRFKCLGNAVNPYQIYPILKAIHEIEVSK